MSFVVITTDGQMLVRARRANLDAINDEVGEPGLCLVRLHRTSQLFGFVNDAGLVISPPLARNPVGACVLAMCGANMSIYAGPVVITGWEEPSERSEIRDLAPHLVNLVKHIHAEVTGVLAGGASRFAASETAIRDYAERVRTAEPDPVRILTGQEAWDALRGGS